MEENNNYEKKENIVNETVNENVDIKKDSISSVGEQEKMSEEEKKKDLTFLLIVFIIIVIFIFFMPNIYKKLNPTTVTVPSKEPEKQEEKITNMTYRCISTENNLEDGYELSKSTTYSLVNEEMNSIKINDSYSFEIEEQYLLFKEKIQTEENFIGEFDDMNLSYFHIVTLDKKELQNENYPRTKEELLKLINEKKMSCSITEG